MPRERTLDARLSALERTLDPDGRPGVETPAGTGPTASQTAEDPHNPSSAPTHGSSGATATEPDARVATLHDVDRRLTALEDDIEERLSTLEDQIGQLEAGLQAVRGYVGNIEHVNQSVERRANAAIAAVERLESAPTGEPALATIESRAQAGPQSQSGSAPDAAPAANSPPDSSTDEPVANEQGHSGLRDRLAGIL